MRRRASRHPWFYSVFCLLSSSLNPHQPLFLIAQQFHCAFHGNPLEEDVVARAELAELPEIRGDDVGGFGVSAGGLVLHEQDDGLAVGWDLNGAERDAFAHHAAAPRGERGT